MSSQFFVAILFIFLTFLTNVTPVVGKTCRQAVFKQMSKGKFPNFESLNKFTVCDFSF